MTSLKAGTFHLGETSAQRLWKFFDRYRLSQSGAAMRGDRNGIELRPPQPGLFPGRRKAVGRIAVPALLVYQETDRNLDGTIPKRPGIQSEKGEPIGFWATVLNRLKAMPEQDVYSRCPDLR